MFSFSIRGTEILLISFLALLDGNDEDVFSSFHIVLFALELISIHSSDLKTGKNVHSYNTVIFNSFVW